MLRFDRLCVSSGAHPNTRCAQDSICWAAKQEGTLAEAGRGQLSWCAHRRLFRHGLMCLEWHSCSSSFHPSHQVLLVCR